MLSIIDLHANIDNDNKTILKGVNLTVNPGELHIILGPNGSGKSTLGKVLLGHPKYTRTSGEIHFKEKNISSLPTHERAKEGIFLSHQHPAAIEGVSLFELLRASQKETGEHLSLFKFKKLVKSLLSETKLDESFLEREFNKGSSGGEQKKTEIISLLSSNAQLAFLDEIDSGLDFDALKIVSQGIKNFLKKENTAVVLVSHSKHMIEHIQPTKIHIFCDGRIGISGGIELYEKLNEVGYEGLLNEQYCQECEKKDCKTCE